jgi:hypothetical protein
MLRSNQQARTLGIVDGCRFHWFAYGLIDLERIAMDACLIAFGAAAMTMGPLVYWLWRADCNNRIIFTPFALFCVTELVFLWPATIYARMTGVSKDLYATGVVLSSFVAFLVGYLVVAAPRRRMRSAAQFWSKPTEGAAGRSHGRAIVGCALALILLGLYLYRGLPPGSVAMFRVMLDGIHPGVADFVADQRLQLTKGHLFGGEYRGQGIIRSIMSAGWPLLTTISLLIYLQRRQTFWMVASAALGVAGFVYIGGDGTRAPVLWALISVLVTLSYEAQIRVRTCLWFTGMLLGLFVALSLSQKLAGASDRGALVSEGSAQLVDRLFVGNGINSIHVIEFVRSGDLALRYGDIHTTDLLASLPGVSDHEPFAHELFRLQNPSAKPARTTFSSMTYLGRLYGDFGWAGCVVGYVLMGSLIGWASRALLSQRKTVFRTALAGLITMKLGQINLLGATVVAVSLLVVSAVGVMYMALFMVGFQRRRMPTCNQARDPCGRHWVASAALGRAVVIRGPGNE